MTHAPFKDYFSLQSADYQKYRPRYPDALYSWLAGISPDTTCAWDCATGNGQAAIGLSHYFNRVIATDASDKQLSHAIPANNVEYHLAHAEHTLLADQSVELITVAQALHWFDIEAFYREVNRVLKPGGIIAVWSYNLLGVSPEIDRLVNYLYADILDAYWPAERRWIENGYRDIAFPFQRIMSPEFNMQAQWTLPDLLGYFQTWSAVQNYIAARSVNPVLDVQADLKSAWGDEMQIKTIRWPLQLMVGHILEPDRRA